MGQVVSATDLVRGVFAALDAKGPAAVTAQMTDEVRMRLGNADFVEGKATDGGRVAVEKLMFRS